MESIIAGEICDQIISGDSICSELAESRKRSSYYTAITSSKIQI